MLQSTALSLLALYTACSYYEMCTRLHKALRKVVRVSNELPLAKDKEDA